MPVIIPAQGTSYGITSASIHLQPGFAINVSANNAINSNGFDNIDLILNGFTAGDSSGIVIGSGDDNPTISVAETATVYGATNDGIGSSGLQTRINNEGTITSSQDDGIEIFAPADNSKIVNGGSIFGENDGIYSFGANLEVINTGVISGDDGIQFFEATTITNSGLIAGISNNLELGGNGIRSGLTDIESSTVYNSGTISGELGSYQGSDGAETIYNSGVMQGDVILENGDDNYIASGDGLVEGRVRAGAGNDQLTGGTAADTFFGGNGNDKMRGNEGADTLEGGNGRDIILGGDGEDVITGGNAGDLLLGGAGADEFLFTDVNDIGTTSSTRDEIRDFEQGSDIINLDQMVAGEFSFLGTGGFTGSAAPELRLVEVAGSTFVQLDYDGDGAQDGRMLIRGVQDMTEADFIL